MEIFIPVHELLKIVDIYIKYVQLTYVKYRTFIFALLILHRINIQASTREKPDYTTIFLKITFLKIRA